MPKSKSWAASGGTHQACWRGWSADANPAELVNLTSR
jgi:hypothetical protein